MRKLGLKSFILMIGVCASAMTSANLITNGGFEDTDVRENSWAWFNSNHVNGWQGSNIEIWDTYNNVTAFEGTQHAELNAHPSYGNAFSIFQTIATQVGSTYDLSFAYSARSNHNESFLVNLNAADDTNILSTLMDDHEVGQWSVFNSQFVAIDLSTTLRFTSVSPYSGTVGNFLDNIVVKQVFSPEISSRVSEVVSEPAGLLLFGFVLMAMMRNRANKKS
jgi:hypothetical protein